MTNCFTADCARPAELCLRGGLTGNGADVELCGPCGADLIDTGRARRLGPFGLTMITPHVPTVPARGVRNCGECLMEAVEIVQLTPAGVCPRCGADYGA